MKKAATRLVFAAAGLAWVSACAPEQPYFGPRDADHPTGYTDEKKFDREIASKMPLGDLVAKISCPMLVGIGEFDELTRLEQAIESYERVRAPKELRVYENEFHPLGGEGGCHGDPARDAALEIRCSHLRQPRRAGNLTREAQKLASQRS